MVLHKNENGPIGRLLGVYGLPASTPRAWIYPFYTVVYSMNSSQTSRPTSNVGSVRPTDSSLLLSGYSKCFPNTAIDPFIGIFQQNGAEREQHGRSHKETASLRCISHLKDRVRVPRQSGVRTHRTSSVVLRYGARYN